MAYALNTQVVNNQNVNTLDVVKQAKERSADSSTLSVVYLLADSTNKAQSSAKQSLGSSAPSALGSSAPTSGLTPAEQEQLNKDLEIYQQIEAAWEAYQQSGKNESDMEKFSNAVKALLDQTGLKPANLRSLMDNMSDLINKTGNQQLISTWNDAKNQKGSILNIIDTKAKSSGTDQTSASLLMLIAIEESDKFDGLLKDFKALLGSLGKQIAALYPPSSNPDKPIKKGQMISFRELFALMMKLMTSQQDAQTADANLGQALSELESNVIKQMSSSLQKYYKSNIDGKTGDTLSANTAKLNVYKTEWDNFKDQVDGNVQSMSNAAGTVDVNNLQQTTDFEKDVLQTWGNVANQIAAL